MSTDCGEGSDFGAKSNPQAQTCDCAFGDATRRISTCALLDLVQISAGDLACLSLVNSPLVRIPWEESSPSYWDFDPDVDIWVEVMVPGSSALERLDKVVDFSELNAIIIIAYASGATPDRLNPWIKRIVKRGVPVFIVSDNVGENHGIQRLKYATQTAPVEAGATPLRNANVNHLAEVIYVIRQAVHARKEGKELATTLVSVYGSPTKVEEG